MEGERIEGGDDVNGKIIGGGGGEWEERRRGEKREGECERSIQ